MWSTRGGELAITDTPLRLSPFPSLESKELHRGKRVSELQDFFGWIDRHSTALLVREDERCSWWSKLSLTCLLFFLGAIP